MRLALVLAAILSSASAQTLIVGNKAEDTVSFIDLAEGKEVARRETGRAPHEIAVSPDGRTAVVVSYRTEGYTGNTLHLFDIAEARKAGEISLGESEAPHGLKWIPGTDNVIVTTEASRDVVIVNIDKREVIGRIPTGQDGTHLVAVTPDGTRAFTGNIGSGTVTVLDLMAMTKIADLQAGGGTEAIAVTPDGLEVWAGNNETKTIDVFDAETLEKTATFETAGVPIRVEIGPDGDLVAVSQYDRGVVAFHDRADFEKLGQVDLAEADARTPVTLLFAPEGDRIWAAATGSRKVVEIDLDTFAVIRTLPAGEGSDGLGYSWIDAKPVD